MKKIIIGLIFICIVIFAFLLSNDDQSSENNNNKIVNINYDRKDNQEEFDFETDNPVVKINIENYGDIYIELLEEYAKNTVANFVNLVNEGFYDNNNFHRLVKGFVLQGGDPTGTGTGGEDNHIKGEFENNGFKNNLKHEKGIVSMARSQDNDSASSQFFIVLDKKESLDGSYAAFGKVIEGIDILTNIEENEEIENETTGKLKNNIKIVKATIDLNKYNKKSVEMIK